MSDSGDKKGSGALQTVLGIVGVDIIGAAFSSDTAIAVRISAVVGGSLLLFASITFKSILGYLRPEAQTWLRNFSRSYCTWAVVFFFTLGALVLPLVLQHSEEDTRHDADLWRASLELRNGPRNENNATLECRYSLKTVNSLSTIWRDLSTVLDLSHWTPDPSASTFRPFDDVPFTGVTILAGNDIGAQKCGAALGNAIATVFEVHAKVINGASSERLAACSNKCVELDIGETESAGVRAFLTFGH